MLSFPPGWKCRPPIHSPGFRRKRGLFHAQAYAPYALPVQTLFDSLSTLSQECKTPLTNQVVDEDTRGKKLSKKMEPAKQLKKLSNKDLKKMEDEALKPLADISTNASNSFTQWLGARRETIVRH